MNKIELIGVQGIPLINKGDDISNIILEKLDENNIILRNNDILVIAQIIISKSLGLVQKLNDIKPSQKAKTIFYEIEKKVKEANLPFKNPNLIQAILNESKEILKAEHVLITETKHGFICANAGIDSSNVKGKDNISFLPEDSDKEAKIIKESIKRQLKVDIAVIISDSFGRPFRKGTIGVALGSAGIEPLLDKRGYKDLYGKELRTTLIGQVDNLASSAQLIMGESNEGLPIVLIRGYNFYIKDNTSIKSILREKKYDLFSRKNESVIENLLKGRKSYKSRFIKREINENLIKFCIKISEWAPKAHNRCLGKYLIVKKTQRKDLIDMMNQKLYEDLRRDDKPQEFIINKIKKTRIAFLEAPILILLCLDSSKLDPYLDEERKNNEFLIGVQSVSASAIYFILALESKGLKSCWYSAPLFASEIVQNILKLSETLKPMAFFTIGYPKKVIKEEME
ncbi:MAG: coenzyme F420-0:L-glutamate ligase [Candidatus Lokiarchaeota archaeon]|nr:coenzyme F420-0:L-glutamate ligase [Candidatus Lokiarchaeota archaeon]